MKSENNKEEIIEGTALPMEEGQATKKKEASPVRGELLNATAKELGNDLKTQNKEVKYQKGEEVSDSVEKEEQINVEEKIDRIEKALLDQAQEGEKPQSSNFTFSKIIGGDILSAQVLRNNIGLILLIVFFVIIYITNRYNAQKYLIEIDKLNTELEDAKYRALSSSSQLTEKTRESHILELLKNKKDSVLKISDRPPYIVNVPE